MIDAVHSALREILDNKKYEVDRLVAEGVTAVGDRDAPRLFRDFLDGRTGIIAEIKPGSPSAGTLSDEVDPVARAELYESAGASTVSVLTERTKFGGDPDWIGEVRRKVKIPVLRKDFLIHPVQVDESYNLGADIILVIVRILSDQQVDEIVKRARELSLDILFEVHDRRDIERILPMNPGLVGVNSRDLSDFTVNTDIFEELVKELPESSIRISESGIKTPQEVLNLKAMGYHGCLVGETLMRMDDPGRFLAACGTVRRDKR